MSDIDISPEHNLTFSINQPATPSKDVVELVSIDPRQNPELQKIYKQIIQDQYEYFKQHGEGQFKLKNFPHQIRQLPDGRQIYLPDIKNYTFHQPADKITPTAQTIQATAEKSQTVLQSIRDQILPFAEQLPSEQQQLFAHLKNPSPETARQYSLTKPDDLKSYINQLKNIHSFLSESNTLQKFLDKTDAGQNNLLRESAQSAFVINPYISAEEINKIITETTSSQDRYRRYQSLAPDIDQAQNKLLHAFVYLDAARACVDIQNPDFLRSEESSPIFLSYWLGEAGQNLAAVDFAKIGVYIQMLADDFKNQHEVFEMTQKDIFQQINEVIQQKQPEETPKEELKTEKDDWRINDYIWIPKDKYSEMMSRAGQSAEETLKKFYKDDKIGLQRALDKLKLQQPPSERLKQQKQERQRQVQPTMKLLEKQSPTSSFREFDHELFKNQTKGAIETIDPTLAHGSLFVTSRVDLGKNGYQPLPSSYKNIPIPVFSKEQTIDAKTSIVHFPCGQGIYVQLPLPNNYELVSIGFSEEKNDYNDLKKVPVAENEGDQTYSFTNLHSEGYIHYVIQQKSQPDVWSYEEQQKYKNTFESSFDRPEIKQVIQKARALKTVEEKINFIQQELSQMDFIYTKGSDLLDNLYHQIGRDRLYALVENIGIGHCQLFSQTVGHIFRQAGISAQVAIGEISTHYAFGAVGHAKVEYCDEQGVVHEFEATNIAYDKSHRLKQSAQIDQETFEKLAQKAAQTQNPKEFQTACAEIKTMMIEETPSFEKRIAELDDYVNRFNQQIAQGVTTEDDFYKLQKLGLSYDLFRFGYWAIKKTDKRYDLYKQYLKIKPVDQCENHIFQSLTSQLLTNALSENDLIKITEQLMMNDYNGRLRRSEVQPDFYQPYIAVRAWRVLKDAAKDIAALTKSEFILKKIAEFGTSIGRINWFGNDLNQLLPLLQAVQPEKVDSAKKSATLAIMLNSVNGVLPDREKILITENDLEARQKVKDFFSAHPWLKAFITNPDSWPAKPLDHNGFQHLVSGETSLFSQSEKESLAYDMIKKYLPQLSRVNEMSELCNSLRKIGLDDILINSPTSPERKTVIKMIQELIERDFKTRLASSKSPLIPFISSYQEMASFTGEQAELYLQAEFKNDELGYSGREWSLDQANHYFLGVKHYFPELTISQELINQWNDKYETSRSSQKLPELTYDVLETTNANVKNYTIDVQPKFNNNLAKTVDLFEPHLWPDKTKTALFGEAIAQKLDTMEKLCHPPKFLITYLPSIMDQNADTRNLVKQFVQQQREAILDTVLLNCFWSDTKAIYRYDFLLLHNAAVKNQPAPENISQEVKDFYKLIPSDVISLWLDSKNKSSPSTQVLLIGKTESETKQNLTFTEKMTSVLSAKETKTDFHTLAEQTQILTGKSRYQKEHPFGNFKDMSPALFALLADTAHDGPESRRKLTVIERTFRNHLNREGEFVNINQSFVQKGTELAGLKKYEGEDISAIDWNASARSAEYIVKQTYREEEPKHNICFVNLDNLVMRSQKEFEPHARWETIFTETYDKLFSLMLDASAKKKPLETRLYFHGKEIFKTGLPRFTPLPQQQDANRISIIKDAVAEIFAEINQFIPLLQEEYVISVKEKTIMPFLKPAFLPNLRSAQSTNLIVVNNKHNVGRLAQINQHAGSRVV